MSIWKELDEAGWLHRDCGIQHGVEVRFYYPPFITVTLVEEDKKQVRSEDIQSAQES